VALEPTGTLFQPIASPIGRFFKSGGVERRGAMAKAGEPDAEIGILRHIERIPAVDLAQDIGAEMVGRTAQRHGHTQYIQTGQKEVEPQGIIEREQARQRYYGANATIPVSRKETDA
ncbi:MAG TPA: hypothetical protein VN682_00625, partial [Terriglobales bacterium]|nr:hypothetical protein [Terriglobales bacterium]